MIRRAEIVREVGLRTEDLRYLLCIWSDGLARLRQDIEGFHRCGMCGERWTWRFVVPSAYDACRSCYEIHGLS